MAKRVVVVRVGTKTTHIVHMENTDNSPTIYGCVRVPTPEGAIEDGMVTDVIDLGRRIKSACQDKGIRTTDAIFVIASSKIASREATVPSVGKAKLTQLINAKIPDMFPVDTEQYIFSHVLQGKEYEVVQEVANEPEGPQDDQSFESESTETGAESGEEKKEEKKASAKIQDVRVFAAPEALVESYYSLATAAGLNIVAIEADANSVFQIMRRQVKSGISLSLQVNRINSLVNVIDSEKLYLQRVVPYGVSSFTDVMQSEEIFQTPDYESALNVLQSQRVLVPNLNMENENDDLAFGKRIDVTDSADYLINNVSRVIEYYNTHFEGEQIEEILLTGQGCNVVGLAELLENELGIRVTMPSTMDGIRFNRRVNIDAAILQYVNCFGAVFNPVRLVPKEIALREASKGGLVVPTIVSLALAGLAVVIALFSYIQLFIASAQKGQLEAKYNSLAPLQAEYDNLVLVGENYTVTEDLAVLLGTNNNYFHALVSELSEIVPTKFTIQSIQSTEDKVTISATTADRLSSLSALKIQLNQMEGIKDSEISAISESVNTTSGKKEYSYSLSFIYDNAEKDEKIKEIESSGTKTGSTSEVLDTGVK